MQSRQGLVLTPQQHGILGGDKKVGEVPCAKQLPPLSICYATQSRQGLVLQAPRQRRTPRGTSKWVKCIKQQLNLLAIEGKVQSSSALCGKKCARQLPIYNLRVEGEVQSSSVLYGKKCTRQLPTWTL